VVDELTTMKDLSDLHRCLLKPATQLLQGDDPGHAVDMHSDSAFHWLRIRSLDRLRCDFEIGLGHGAASDRCAMYIGLGALLWDYESIRTEADAEELSGDLRRFLGSWVVSESRMSNGRVFIACYAPSLMAVGGEPTKFTFRGPGKPWFSRGEKQVVRYAPWIEA